MTRCEELTDGRRKSLRKVLDRTVYIPNYLVPSYLEVAGLRVGNHGDQHSCPGDSQLIHGTELASPTLMRIARRNPLSVSADILH